MRKCLLKFKIISGLLILCFSASAQTVKTFTRNDAEIGSCISVIHGKETYQYYEDDNGNYVKNGTYSLSGIGKTNINNYNGHVNVTETYKATATFKKDLLNGTLSVLNTCTGTVNGKAANFTMAFTAGYSNGIPNGKWTWKDNTEGFANSSEMTFTNGVMTGLYKYDCTNSESYTKSIKKISGQFNAKGEFHGTWSETVSKETIYDTEKEVSELIFSNGILLSCIKRDGAGKLLNPDNNRAEKKTLATKYANAEITKTALYEKGYVFEERKTILYCPYIYEDRIGGYKLDFNKCEKSFLELTKINLATDSLISLYEEKKLKEVDGNIEWAKAQNKNDNTDRIAEVRENYSFEHFYRSEEVGASLYYNYQRYYLNSSQISRLDSLKRIVDNRIDTEFKAIEAERLAEKQKKEAEEQQKAELAAKNEQQTVESYLRYALQGIVSVSKNPATKAMGFDLAIRQKCNNDVRWRNVFSTDAQSVRYKKVDGSYGVETPQEVMLKKLFSGIHPIVNWTIISYEKDEKEIYNYTVVFEQKTKKKAPSKYYQGNISVYKNGAILLDNSMKNVIEVQPTN